MTAFLFHPDCLRHDAGPNHPERPDRLRAILRQVESSGLSDRLLKISPEKADVEWIREIHEPGYIQHVEETSRQGGGCFDADTFASPASYDAALYGAGAALMAVDTVISGEASNAVCAIRPPGHHAERDRAMGFCLFNNVAIAARYAQKRHGLERVMIIDWDVHHGNGTQHAFEDDPSVFFFSTHQYPFYPGTGGPFEIGTGSGEGFVLNVPLPAGSGDDEYESVFRQKLRPKADAFRPELVLVSAGFDAHQDDPLASMSLTERGFEVMTKTVKGIAADHSEGRLVSLLEGGYDLNALARSVEVHIRALMEKP